MQKIFISYANAQYEPALDFNIHSALTVGGFDTAWKYGPSSLSADFKQQHNLILQAKKGAGYWLWKPYIICDALEKSAESDIIFYSDSASYFLTSAKPLLNLPLIYGQDVIPFELELLEGHWTKRDTFLLTETDLLDLPNTKQRCGSPIIIRNSPFSKQFFTQYLQIACDPRAIADGPNELGLENHEGFQSHRHDQSIFSLLSKKYGLQAFRDPSQWGNSRMHEYANSNYPQIVNLTRQANPKNKGLKFLMGNYLAQSLNAIFRLYTKIKPKHHSSL
jgi:hypothetical protein